MVRLFVILWLWWALQVATCAHFPEGYLLQSGWQTHTVPSAPWVQKVVSYCRVVFSWPSSCDLNVTWWFRYVQIQLMYRNILVPILIYLVTAPLTLRCVSYKMGHAYELQIPRGRKEWETSLKIQSDFPTSVGCTLEAIACHGRPW